MTVIYVDYMSQPSRAIIIFCRLNGIPVEEKLVNIARQEQRSESYKSLNPLAKLPCLQDQDFVLPESAAILRYLASTAHTPDHWYPDDPKKRAKVDAALDWNHSNVRANAAGLTWHRVIGKNLKQPVSEGQARHFEAGLQSTFKTMEKFWLAKTAFVAGDEISLADLQYACEIQQLCLLEGAEQGPTMQDLLKPFPAVQKWLARVADETEPEWSKASSVLNKAAQRGRERKAKTQQSKL